MKRADIAGQEFGRLTAVEPSGSKSGRVVWRCRCACGEVVEMLVSQLRSGNTRSCGCLQRDAASAANTTHGMSHTLTYSTWSSMRDRCNNPNNVEYHNYGGRGIKVCTRWTSFEAFLHDMGEKPEGLTLDRKNTNLNYEPNNCRWATASEQMHNMRKNLWITHQGETLILSDWSRRLNIDAGTLRREYLRNGSLDLSIEGRTP